MKLKQIFEISRNNVKARLDHKSAHSMRIRLWNFRNKFFNDFNNLFLKLAMLAVPTIVYITSESTLDSIYQQKNINCCITDETLASFRSNFSTYASILLGYLGVVLPLLIFIYESTASKLSANAAKRIIAPIEFKLLLTIVGSGGLFFVYASLTSNVNNLVNYIIFTYTIFGLSGLALLSYLINILENLNPFVLVRSIYRSSLKRGQKLNRLTTSLIKTSYSETIETVLRDDESKADYYRQYIEKQYPYLGRPYEAGISELTSLGIKFLDKGDIDSANYAFAHAHDLLHFHLVNKYEENKANPSEADVSIDSYLDKMRQAATNYLQAGNDEACNCIYRNLVELAKRTSQTKFDTKLNNTFNFQTQMIVASVIQIGEEAIRRNNREMSFQSFQNLHKICLKLGDWKQFQGALNVIQDTQKLLLKVAATNYIELGRLCVSSMAGMLLNLPIKSMHEGDRYRASSLFQEIFRQAHMIIKIDSPFWAGSFGAGFSGYFFGLARKFDEILTLAMNPNNQNVLINFEHYLEKMSEFLRDVLRNTLKEQDLVTAGNILDVVEKACITCIKISELEHIKSKVNNELSDQFQNILYVLTWLNQDNYQFEDTFAALIRSSQKSSNPLFFDMVLGSMHRRLKALIKDKPDSAATDNALAHIIYAQLIHHKGKNMQGIVGLLLVTPEYRLIMSRESFYKTLTEYGGMESLREEFDYSFRWNLAENIKKALAAKDGEPANQSSNESKEDSSKKAVRRSAKKTMGSARKQ